jgi:aspartate/methionine/tyrosine aminotransferase
MNHSPYLAWAKERAGLRYTLARSGTPSCTLEELGAGPEDLVLHSHDEDGWLPLRAAVGERYGVGGERVALAHGCTLANHLVASLLVRPGDIVLVERPGYEPLADLVRSLGAEALPFDRPMERGGPDLTGAVAAALAPGVRLVILSDPHNPTGARVPEEVWRGLATLAERSDFHVLVDEIYIDLDPGPPRTAAALSPRIVATGGLTKSFGLGALRIGWVLATPDLAARVIRLNDLFTVVVAHLCERLGLKALQRAETILAPRRALLEANRERVDAFIAARPELDWLRPEVGSVGWVIPTGVPLDRLEELLEREYESAIAPGRFFGVPACFRVGYGMPADDLEEALRRLGEALDRPA